MTYKIERIDEECTCNWCECPLDVGDTVHMQDDDPYCSNYCVRLAAASETTRHE